MKPLIHRDFLLQTKTARELYHNAAERMPVIDFHNHLDPKEIYEDKCCGNIAKVWLSQDHYKWRAMRAWGIGEAYITGEKGEYEKFLAWADTVQNCIGNPLYHWTHLELKRYFGIDKLLCVDTAEEIWKECNEKLAQKEFSVRNLLRMQQLEVLCTTDDPLDDLKYHKKLKEEGFEISVLPTFRPEKAMGIEKEGFSEYIKKLGETCGKTLDTAKELLEALNQRLDWFLQAGCRISDHSLESGFFLPASYQQVNEIYRRRLLGEKLTEEECAKYRGYVLTQMGRSYAKNDMVMQLHIGALRNNATRFYDALGTDIGTDSLTDRNYAKELSGLLDALDKKEELPKTILYYLNPKDADMLSAMAGNFQGNEQGIRGKIQLGSAWWFCDHKSGMERQMDALCSSGLLAAFVGMLTDSRSFLSFPRHEYFRRILCNKIGGMVENGEYPRDMEYLNHLVEDICCNNARNYFHFR